MKLKYNINFRLESRKDRATGELIDRNVPINLDFTFDHKRLVYFSGYRIDTTKWDSTLQRVKKNNFNPTGISASEINQHLNDLENKVETIYKEQKAQNLNPSAEFIKNELKIRLNEESKPQNLLEVYKLFVDNEGKNKNWTKGTIVVFNKQYHHLEKFQRKYKSTLTFDSITDIFLSRFIDFEQKDLNHVNTTIAKNLKIFNWFMNWATNKGYNKNLAYRKFKPEFKGTKNTEDKNIIFLNWDELIHLYNLKIKQNYLRQVRDIFCFCCFTGLRYSDVYNLKHGNIFNSSIKITTVKTDDTLTIPLNKYSRSLLEKYKDYHFKNDKCFPVISNQKMNEYLKELGKLADFTTHETVITYRGAERSEKTYKKWELLSTHAGRKTFIVNAIALEIPLPVIMSITGHSSFDAMKPYIKIVDALKQREMNKFNK